MKTNPHPAWMDKLAADIETAMEASGIKDDPWGASIFIAVQQKEDGRKAVVYDLQGVDLPLAEAIGTLVYNRDMPDVLHVAATAALAMRHREEKKARILRAARGQRPNKNNKPHNKKRK